MSTFRRVLGTLLIGPIVICPALILLGLWPEASLIVFLMSALAFLFNGVYHASKT